MFKSTVLASTLAIGLVASACGSSSSNNNNSTTYSVSGQVIYTGTMPTTSTSLTVSADTRQTPVCNATEQDIPVKFKMYTSPTFPVSYELTGLPAGAYYLFGFLNTDVNSGMCPDSTDICGHSAAAIDIGDANPAPTIDLTLDIIGCQAP